MKEKLKKIFTKKNIFRYILPLLFLLTLASTNLASLNAAEIPDDLQNTIINSEDNFLTTSSVTSIAPTNWHRVTVTMNRPYISTNRRDILFIDSSFNFGSSYRLLWSTTSYSSLDASALSSSTVDFMRNTEDTIDLGLSASGNVTYYVYVYTLGGSQAAQYFVDYLLNSAYIYRSTDTTIAGAYNNFYALVADLPADYQTGYDDGYDDGVRYGEQHPVGSQLLNLFSFIIGVVINIFLFILTLEVFDISLLAIATVMFVVVGIIWVLKLIRG